MAKKHITILIIFALISSILCSCIFTQSIELDNITPIPKPTDTIQFTSDPSTPEPIIAPSPSPTTFPVPEQTRFSLIAAGDVMAHDDNLKAAYNEASGQYSFIENFIHVKEIIEKADIAICNLETVTAGESEIFTSYPRFNTPASILDGLKFAGFDVIVTANNHSLDRGVTGVLKTLEEIKARDMLSTGSYKNPGLNYLTVNIKGVPVSFLAYTQHLNGNLPLLPDDKHYMVNQMVKESIIKDIKKASEHSDLVVVYLHWGNEYTRGTEDWQTAYAHDLIEAGADVILGTHPHVVRPDEIYTKDGRPKYIIYSMGNYISNFIRQDNRQNAIFTEDGVMIKLDFIVDDSGLVELEKVVPIPTWPYKYTNETGIHYEIIPVENLDSVVHSEAYADNEAKDSYIRTMESLTGFNLSD